MKTTHNAEAKASAHALQRFAREVDQTIEQSITALLDSVLTLFAKQVFPSRIAFAFPLPRTTTRYIGDHHTSFASVRIYAPSRQENGSSQWIAKTLSHPKLDPLMRATSPKHLSTRALHFWPYDHIGWPIFEHCLMVPCLNAHQKANAQCFLFNETPFHESMLSEAVQHAYFQHNRAITAISQLLTQHLEPPLPEHEVNSHPIFASTHTAIAVTDQNGRILAVNQACVDLLQQPLEIIKDTPLNQWLAENIQHAHLTHNRYRYPITDNQFLHTTIQSPTISSPIAVSVQFYRDQRSTPTIWWVWIHKVTDLETGLVVYTQPRSVAEHQLLFEASPIAMIRINEQLELELANAQWFELTGSTAQPNYSQSWLQFIPRDTIETLAQQLFESFATPYGTTFDIEFDKRRGSQFDGSSSDSTHGNTTPIETFRLSAHIPAIKHDDRDGRSAIIALQNITVHSRSVEQLKRYATEDPLTRLANRRIFEEQLNLCVDALQWHEGFTLLALDVDNFKQINDSFGHGVGDELLQIFAQRLLINTRSEDIVARIGGDEFMVILKHCWTPHDIRALLQKLLERLNQPVNLGSNLISVGASIGAYIATPDAHSLVDSTSIREAADHALYQAKVAGKGRYVIYADGHDHALKLHRTLQKDLQTALAKQSVYLAYQGIWSESKQTIGGFEALLRWKHPDLGIVSPNDFIPIAENTGAIEPITLFVIERACKDFAKLREIYPIDYISINISARLITRPRIFEALQYHIQQHGLRGDHLLLEITETAFLSANKATHEFLDRARTLNVRIALDDFGTGYSSLSYLQKFSFDRLKIDRVKADCGCCERTAGA